MTGPISLTRCLMAATLSAVLWTLIAPAANAQCSTCATPTVAYSPVVVGPAVAAPTVVAYDGWYPGRMLDRMRIRRWTSAAPATPVYTAGYTPYAAAYAPYTAGYAPYAAPYSVGYAPYSASYTPYVTAYAPLSRPVMQTSYMPIASAAAPCSSCAQTSYSPVVASYAPATAVLAPVVSQPACGSIEPSCSACSSAAPCSACSSDVSYDTSVAAASYAEVQPACSSCASGGSQVVVSPPGGVAASGAVGGYPATPQPGLGANEPIPDASQSQYNAQRPDPAAQGSGVEQNGTIQVDPGPATDEPANGAVEENNTSFEAPHLLSPGNSDRTANRPTVDVHHAVYRQSGGVTKASATVAKPALNHRTQAEIDAEGWESVPQN